MYRVADTISRRSQWLRHHPELPQKKGVLVVLDPDQVLGPVKPIVRVRVLRPDGSSGTLEVAEVHVNPAGVVGLFFSNIDEVEIPRGSVIQPLE
jgi:hypothetical protein